MDKIIVAIHQPNFFPWYGYFKKISSADIFIFLDDVQFPKTGGSYVNRAEILISGRRKWLNVEIKREHGIWNINESQFAFPNWQKRIKSTIQVNYAKSPFFEENIDFLTSLIDTKAANLAEFNINVIKSISDYLMCNKQFFTSSNLNVTSTSTQRLIDLIKKVNGNVYLSGMGGDNYQEKDLFSNNSIDILYNDVKNFTYTQFNTNNFEKGLSIIDVLFNLGRKKLISSLNND